MKRFTINLISSFLAFAAGIFTASSWNTPRHAEAMDQKRLVLQTIERCPPAQTQLVAATEASHTLTPEREYLFGGGLKLVPEKVQLKSESMRYDINVKYPQIAGDDSPAIRKINQHIKALATEKYQWPLNLTTQEVRSGQQKLPGTYNSVNVDYEISVATDSFLSFYFFGYSYGVGAAHAVQESVAVNYDLTSGQQLKLSDLFKRGSNYLEFIAKYCKDYLGRDLAGSAIIKGAIDPNAKNFDSWHITHRGITFNFDACEVLACSEGDQAVEIPFSEMKSLLNPGIPGKFKITYP